MRPDREKIAKICLKHCLRALFKKSDAIYGQHVGGPVREIEIELCALLLAPCHSLNDLTELFQLHWKSSPKPPDAIDIVNLDQQRQRLRHVAS